MSRSIILRQMQSVKIEEIIQNEHIRASVTDVFQALTVSRIIDEWGGGPSRIQAKVGGKWSLWDGEMSGVVKEIEYPGYFAYTLREASWDESCPDSFVSWTLMEDHRGTNLLLQHTGLPNRKLREIHKEGWGDYFLGPLKAYLERGKKAKR